MTREGLESRRIVAGGLLVSALLVAVLAGVVLVGSGASNAFFDLLGGSLSGMKPYVSAFRFSTYMWAVTWVTLMLGFVALTPQLERAGDDRVASLSLAVFMLATVLALLEAAFTVGLTVWAIEETAGSGVTPEVYEVLNDGLLGRIQFVYTILGFVAEAGFALSLMKTRLVPRWVGVTALAWSLIWLAIDPGVFGIPALLLFMPAGIGIALLTSDQNMFAMERRLPEETVDG